MDKQMTLDVQLCTYLMARQANPALHVQRRFSKGNVMRGVYVKQPNAARGKLVYMFLPATYPSGYGSEFVPQDWPLRTCDEMRAIIETFNNTGVMFALREVTK